MSTPPGRSASDQSGPPAHPAVASSTEEAMAPAYDPSQVEQRTYRWWEEQGFFRPAGGSEPFTIIMPPPNLTGELHIGHAVTDTVEDILIRWHRMQGHDTLWQPGLDHAAIAVNTLVERELRAEGTEPREIGREAFLERVWAFVNRSRDRISEQHRRLGASADWERETFTMDPGPQRAVRTTFMRLYEDGLIYRGERIINWCPDCRTALSDLEVEHEDAPGHFWHVRYPVLDEQDRPTDEYIVIATTRPETIPADTAVAVHPEDERYRHLLGRRVLVPTIDRPVPVIADEAVSMEGGSGALKVTPGHDPVDFEIGERHGLPIINLMAEDGTLTADGGPYAGMERFAARDAIIADLAAAGLLDHVEDYTHAIGHCQRSRTIVEPIISKQWFVRMQPLADPAMAAVRRGDIEFVPKRFERTYFHWMENIRDWCISRQIWWGHRIPVWYCDDCDALTLPQDGTLADPAGCASCGGAAVRQDEDTLDTWFSSGLWPHSALGWPDAAATTGGGDADRFYPTQVMETGYDIIFFWVARMVMLCLYNSRKDSEAAGESPPREAVPFQTVYLHGLVRAADGSKMSKSSGNVVDPLEMIDRYGTDALRYALVSSTSPGNDQRISDQRLEAGRNFANKLWNASRFTIGLVEAGDDLTLPAAGADGAIDAIEDRWILSRCERVVASTDELLGRFELGEAARQARDFFWDEFADWYIELAKVRVRAGDRTPVSVLVHVLDRVLRLLHPVMPFVTEEIWGRLHALDGASDPAPALIVAAYPQAEAARDDRFAEAQMNAARDWIREIRNIRAEKKVDAGRFVEAYVVAEGLADLEVTAEELRPAIEGLARVHPLHIVTSYDAAPSEQVIRSVLNNGGIVLPMAGLFDLDAERQRLGKQIEEAQTEVGRLEQKLANEQFRSRAPAAVVGREEERLSTARTRLEGLEQSLAEVG